MFVLKENDLLQKLLESWIPVKILSFSQIMYCFVQKEKADQIEMVASLEMALWNYWKVVEKH